MTKKEILKHFSAKTEEEAKRNIYKNTDCGAFIEFERGGIVMGSIVEGSDEGTTTFKLKYKDITEDKLEDILKRIENEANLIWNWANKTGKDGMTDAEKGYDFPLL